MSSSKGQTSRLISQVMLTPGTIRSISSNPHWNGFIAQVGGSWNLLASCSKCRFSPTIPTFNIYKWNFGHFTIKQISGRVDCRMEPTHFHCFETWVAPSLRRIRQVQRPARGGRLRQRSRFCPLYRGLPVHLRHSATCFSVSPVPHPAENLGQCFCHFLKFIYLDRPLTLEHRVNESPGVSHLLCGRNMDERCK